MIRRLLLPALLILLPVLALAAGAALMLFNAHGGMTAYRLPQVSRDAGAAVDEAIRSRGEYLARIGGCATCHSARGGPEFAGGKRFSTPYGDLFAPNLTPDPDSGLGNWSLATFRHAMRHGVSPSGIQWPVFPYEHYARMDEADIDAIFAFLSSLDPVPRPRQAERMRFPANLPGAALGWRMLYHRPTPSPQPELPPPLARGRYLVDTIGHCGMCHSPRGRYGSPQREAQLAGAVMTGSDWYAPALDRVSLARFSVDELAAYLRSGTSRHGVAYGPMAETVFAGLAWLNADDAGAMSAYLLQREPAAQPVPRPGNWRRPLAGGEELYARHCADCHGDTGEGRDGVHPPLRGSVAVTAPTPANAIKVVLGGAIAPVTPGNPLPYSMPPFAQTLDDAEVAAVVGYLRSRFGQTSAPGIDEVARLRGIEPH